jgi:DNA replication protein DnaC
MACPDGRCDGSGFLYDEGARRAFDCSCRPARLARRKAAAVAGRIPRRFREVSFDREPLPDLARRNPVVVRAVRDYVSDVGHRLAEGQGMWFSGDVGTGKTTLAMLISKAAMEAGHTVAIYSLPRLLAQLRETYDEDATWSLNGLIDRLCSMEPLHVDDVGAEQTSPWVLEQLYTIVNTRYEDSRAMLLTTNLITLDGDDALRAQIGERTVSRLYEMCGEPLPMHGHDRRMDASFDYPEAPGTSAGAAPRDGDDPDAPPAYGTPWIRAAELRRVD